MTGKRLLFGLAFVASACTSGDTSMQQQEFQCSAVFNLSGTFAPGVANPDNRTCWPIGTWTFTVQMPFTSDTCSPAPTPLQMYVFTGTAMLDNTVSPPEVTGETFTYSDSTTMNTIKVTEGGTGICEGDVSLFSADGKQVWDLHPELNADNTITGFGQFNTYASNQWVGG